MKKTVLITIILLFHLSPSNAETININFDDWCPYCCSDAENPKIPNTEKPGYQLEIINRIFRQKGYDIKYNSLPWARAVKEASKGRLDALLSPSKSEAPDLIFPEEEIGILGWCFYTGKKNSWNYKGVASLKQVRLGFLHGNNFDGEVQAYIEKNRDDHMLIHPEFGTDWIEKNFNRLAMGRITAVLDEPFTLDYFIKTNNLNNQFRKAGCLEGQKMYIAFSPKNPMAEKYAEMFDYEIRELRKSGAFEKILSAYGLSDWK
ncbi:hypothetical protein DENIS_0336 [Desulfonema ishimotonii]|uniref:Uncharacterized protein n=1 Tax=Desulfonema ishimotonii TaxID=45657 RepID=A0A401FR06_9BACT|nr:transporter substrate-binding domain-containing protein [Desulfonema ishimotonii]GBC59397.1 hypothetical protein DENIS_0336 [Desulfonema ishimotonii]